MGLPKVDKFLFCLELETGGITIGVITAILSGISLIVFVLTLAALIVATFLSDGHQHQPENTTAIIGDELKSFENVETSTLLHFLLGLAIFNAILLLYLLFVFFAAINLYRGTKNVRESYKPAIPIHQSLMFFREITTR
jgi:hypothetical protein